MITISRPLDPFPDFSRDFMNVNYFLRSALIKFAVFSCSRSSTKIQIALDCKHSSIFLVRIWATWVAKSRGESFCVASYFTRSLITLCKSGCPISICDFPSKWDFFWICLSISSMQSDSLTPPSSILALRVFGKSWFFCVSIR